VAETQKPNSETENRPRKLWHDITSIKTLTLFILMGVQFFGKLPLGDWAFVVLVVLLLGLRQANELLKIWKGVK